MTRVPISFYLNILAGVIVLFNHYVTSETGDVALNKVTGAAGRFYILFQDAALAFQHGCTSRLETTLCGSGMDGILPHDAVAYLQARYCHLLPGEDTGRTSNGQKPREGYGTSDPAFVYYQPPARPLVPQTSLEGLGRPPNGLYRSNHGRRSRAVWARSGGAMKAVGVLLLRTCASWWWFRAPLMVTGLFLATYSALSALARVFVASVVVRCISQVYVAVVMDFLQCIEWEARRQALDAGVVAMEHAYGLVMHARKRAEVIKPPKC